MRTFKLTILSGFAFFYILLTSCQHEPELVPGMPEVCFDNDVMMIINSNCNVPGCHGDGEGPSLSTYDDVVRFVSPGKPMKSKLHNVITKNSFSFSVMPPKPKQMLSSSQVDIISLWILQGANHTHCSK